MTRLRSGSVVVVSSSGLSLLMSQVWVSLVCRVGAMRATQLTSFEALLSNSDSNSERVRTSARVKDFGYPPSSDCSCDGNNWLRNINSLDKECNECQNSFTTNYTQLSLHTVIVTHSHCYTQSLINTVGATLGHVCTQPLLSPALSTLSHPSLQPAVSILSHHCNQSLTHLVISSHHYSHLSLNTAITTPSHLYIQL